MARFFPAARVWRRLLPPTLVLLALAGLLVPRQVVSRLRIWCLSTARPLVALGAPAEERAARADDLPEAARRRIAELEQENARLNEERLRLLDRLEALQAELYQTAEFRDALARDPLFVRATTSLPARIIARSTNWHATTLLINRGADDRVAVNGGICVGGRVLGVVVEVGPRVSRVAYLTEPGVKIPARILPGPPLTPEGRPSPPPPSPSPTAAPRAAETATLPPLDGLLVGDGRRAELRYVTSQLGGTGGTRPVRPGDYVVTSGLDGVFPRGFLIGRVAQAEPEAEGPCLKILVEPAVTLAAVDAVRVFIRAPASGEPKLEQ